VSNFLDKNAGSDLIVIVARPPGGFSGSLTGGVSFTQVAGIGVLDTGTILVAAEGLRLNFESPQMMTLWNIIEPEEKIRDTMDGANISLSIATGLNLFNIDEMEVRLAGEIVRIQFDRSSMSYLQIELAKIQLQLAFNLINNNDQIIAGFERSAIRSVDTIVITANALRSFAVESQKTFVMSSSDLWKKSAYAVAADIFHDGRHIELYWALGENLYVSRGLAAEQSIIENQIAFLEKIGGPWWEIASLQTYLNDPGAIIQRINVPPALTNTPSAPPQFFTQPVEMAYNTFYDTYVHVDRIPDPGSDWP
jgi:hypothetical protein